MKKFIYGMGVVALMLTASFSFVSCDDYVQDQFTEVNGTIEQTTATLTKKIEDLQKQLEQAIATAKQDAKDYADAQDAKVQEALEALIKAAENKESADSLALANAIEEVKQALGDSTASLKGRIDELEELIRLEKLIGMKDYVDSLYQAAQLVDQQQNQRIDSLVNLFTEAEVAAANLSALTQMSMDESGNVLLGTALSEAIKATVDAYTKSEVEVLISDSLSALRDQAAALHAKTDSVINDLKDVVAEQALQIDSINMDIQDLKVILAEALYHLQDQIDDLSLSTELLWDAVEYLNDCFEDMKNARKKQITSLVLQGAYNNVFGEFRLPVVGINSNLLAGHYSQPVQDIVFPKTDAVLTAEDAQFLATRWKPDTYFEASDVIVEEAGYAYVTVNPAQADISDVTFELVNSLDENIGFEVKAIEPANEKLTFGWTRGINAQPANGLYKVYFGLADDVDPATAKPRFDYESIKDYVKDILDKDKAVFDLSRIAKLIYENCQDILDATAIKATWSEVIDEDTTEYSVYTTYDLAATVMKPLSFGFTGFDEAADKIANKLNKLQLNTFDDIAFDIDFDLDLEFNELDSMVFTDSLYIWYNDKKYKIDNLTDFIDSMNVSYVAAANDAVNQLIEDLKTQIDDIVDDQVGRVNDKVNSYLNKVNNFIDKYNEYLTKVQNKLTDVDFNHYLQPCIILTDENGHFGRVSSNKYFPTFVKLADDATSLVLNPTTYTCELLAPALYKYVAVTAAWNMAGENESDVAKIVNISGHNVAKTFTGKQQVYMENLEAGYLYEIVYQAVDFSGKTVTGKYYICCY